MKRWVSGHKLIKTIFKGESDKFFKAIERGELVPFYPHPTTREEGRQRILPPH
jgi:hypothetical protein